MYINRASLLFAPLVIFLLFGSTLSGDQRLGFRDVSHFYTPLYDYVASRTAETWLPLWNPLDQTGIPLLGETTTAVLYPVRYAIFALPISTESAIAWYVVFHLLLASIAARYAAIWSGTGAIAANLCGILYPLSGSVLFLYTNPPFLVGAAWLPLVLGVLLARQSTDDRTRILIAAPSLAMMILGGDPQVALHAMIVVGGYGLISRLAKCEPTLDLKVVIIVPAMAALMSAPQIAGSVSWSLNSDRIAPAASEDWLDPPATGSRRAESFQFSLAPWHAAELVLPNPSGSLFPVYRRISQQIPGDGRMWTPTLYMGMALPLFLALSMFGIRRIRLDRWIAIAIAGFGLSIGHFGLAMLVQSITGQFAEYDSAIGGPYWLLYHFLPGYDSFRYPAKWLPFLALGLSVATANAFDQFDWRKFGWPTMAGVGLTALVVILVVTAVGANPNLAGGDLAQSHGDEFWGPLNIAGGVGQLRGSVFHAGIALISLMSLTWLPISRSQKQTALLLMVAIDLGVAGSNQIATLSVERERSLLARRSHETLPAESRWMRTIAGDGWPTAWKLDSDPSRLLDVETSLRTSRFGRWHLADRVNMLNNMVSIRSQGMKEFWEGAREATAGMDSDERKQFWEGLRRWLAIDGVIHIKTSSVQVSDRERTATLIDHRQLWSPQPSRLRFHPGADEQSVRADNQSRFAERLAVLVAQFTQQDAQNATESGSVEIDAKPGGGPQSPETTVYRGIEVDQAGVLSRPIFQDRHWIAQIAPAGSNQWQPAVVHQVDRITQGIVLASGRWDIRFSYQPEWLRWSLVIAAVSWIGLLAYVRI